MPIYGGRKGAKGEIKDAPASAGASLQKIMNFEYGQLCFAALGLH
jgi:hypothetical protein